MGGTYYSSSTMDTLSSRAKSAGAARTFTTTASTFSAGKLDPKGVKVRECRDSAAHPNTVGVGVFLDVTGSMGRIPYELVTNTLKDLPETLITHGLPDCQILFGGIGDEYYDRAPLQVGQFESGATELVNDLTSLYIEGGGGGNSAESYELAWHFMANHTSMDCWEKRGIKGFIFTIGDERYQDMNGSKLSNTMGYPETISDKKAETLFNEVSRHFHVYHIHVQEGSYRDSSYVFDQWRGLIGERFLVCEDYKAIPALIATTIAIVHGLDMKTVLASLPASTAAVVSTALARVNSTELTKNTNSGIITL